MDTKLTIATVVPNDYFAPWDYVKSIFRLPNKYQFKTIQSCSVPVNRNTIFEIMKQEKGDLLFIDSDICFEPQDVETIAKDLETHDIVTGLCMLTDCRLAILNKDLKFIKLKEVPPEIFEIGACGGAFLGISRKVIDKMPIESFFELDKDGEVYDGDIGFGYRARQQGFKVWCNPQVRLGHIKSSIIRVGDDIIL